MNNIHCVSNEKDSPKHVFFMYVSFGGDKKTKCTT